MPKILSVKAQTHNPFLNLYELKAVRPDGKVMNYYMASREAKEENLKLHTHDDHANGVQIVAMTGEEEPKIVLVRQYRYPIDGYVYELPAGLIEEGENPMEAAVREVREETGLSFEPLQADDAFTRPFYTTVGLTDESCATAYGYAGGMTSTSGLEPSEALSVVLADRQEAMRILKEEKVATMCAYQLMLFCAAPKGDPFYFLKTP